jgi:hypothetical protein
VSSKIPDKIASGLNPRDFDLHQTSMIPSSSDAEESSIGAPQKKWCDAVLREFDECRHVCGAALLSFDGGRDHHHHQTQ